VRDNRCAIDAKLHRLLVLVVLVAQHGGKARGNVRTYQAGGRTSADGEHTIVVIMVLSCGNAESA